MATVEALSETCAVVASGASGATAALVGVQRAFEEAGVAPVALGASSGSVLFALPGRGLRRGQQFFLRRHASPGKR